MKSPMQLVTQSSKTKNVRGRTAWPAISRIINILCMRSFAEPLVESFVGGTSLRHNYSVLSQIISRPVVQATTTKHAEYWLDAQLAKVRQCLARLCSITVYYSMICQENGSSQVHKLHAHRDVLKWSKAVLKGVSKHLTLCTWNCGKTVSRVLYYMYIT